MGGKSSNQRAHDDWRNDINNMMNEQKLLKWIQDMEKLNNRYNDPKAIPLRNGDFSDPVQSNFSYTVPNKWTKTGNGNIVLSKGLNQGFSSFGGIDQFLVFQIAEGGDVQLTQTIQFPSAGVYLVTFAIASRRNYPTKDTLTHQEHRIEVGIDLYGGQYYEHSLPSRNWTVIEDYLFIQEESVNKPIEFRIRSFGAKQSDSSAYIGKISILKHDKCPYYSAATETQKTKKRTVFDPTITAFNSKREIWDSIERGEYDSEEPKNVKKFRPISNDPPSMNPFPDTKEITTTCYNEWVLKKSGYEYCDTSKTSIRKTDKKSNWINNTDDDNDNVKDMKISNCKPINPTHYGITDTLFQDPTKNCELLGTDVDTKTRIDFSLPITNLFSHNKFAFVKSKCLKVIGNNVVLSDCEEKGTNTTDVQLHSVRRVYNVNTNYFYKEFADEEKKCRIVRFEGLSGKGCMYTDLNNNLKYDPRCNTPDDPRKKFTFDPSNNTFSQTIGSSTKYMTAAGLMNQAHTKLQANPNSPAMVGDIPMKMASCTTGIACDNIPLDTVDLFNDNNRVNIGDQLYLSATEEGINTNVEEAVAYVNLLGKYERYVQDEKRKYEEQKKVATTGLQTAEGKYKFEQEREGQIRNQNQYVTRESYNKILQQTESIRKSGVKETSESQIDKKRTVYRMDHQKTGRVAHQILFILYFSIMSLFLIVLFLKTEVAILWIPIILLVVLFPFWVFFIEYAIGYLFYYVYYILKGSPSYNVPFNSSFVPAFFYYIYYTLFGKPVLHEEVNTDYYAAFQSHGIIPFG